MLDEGMQIFVDEPAEYEAMGDYIVSHWKGQRYVIPISVAQTIVRRLNRVLEEWRIEQSGKVEPLRRHAASS